MWDYNGPVDSCVYTFIRIQIPLKLLELGDRLENPKRTFGRAQRLTVHERSQA